MNTMPCIEGVDHHIWESAGLDVITRRNGETLVAVRICHLCNTTRYIKPKLRLS